MKAYQVKSKKLAGTSYAGLIKEARRIFHDIEKRSKRKPYVRSTYFNKEKVFFDLVWVHLKQKSLKEQAKRLRYFACAIEVVRFSKLTPKEKINPNKKSEKLYRFLGKTPDGEIFAVQVKEQTKISEKYLMSYFCMGKQKSPARLRYINLGRGFCDKYTPSSVRVNTKLETFCLLPLA